MVPQTIKSRLRLVLILGLWLLVGTAPAQILERFDHLSPETGLSQSTVLCILQDQQGYMWFGTEEGLNRYDGYGFRVFGTIQEGARGLTNAFIHVLYEDRNGVLWVGTEEGLNLYNPVRDTIEPAPGRLSSAFITALYPAEKGLALWVGTRNQGLLRLDLSTRQIVGFTGTAWGLPIKHVTALLKDRVSGNLWVGTHGSGLCQVKNAGFEITPSSDFGIPAGEVVTSLYQDRDGVVWVGTTEHGLFQGSEHAGFRPFETDKGFKPPVYIRAILGDQGNNLWVGTEGDGLHRLSADRKSVQTFHHQLDDSDGLSENTIRAIYEDREGLLWFGTKGIDRLVRSPFTHQSDDVHNKIPISGSVVRAIAEDKQGRLWIGTEIGGLNLIDREKDVVIQYRAESGASGGLSSDKILALTLQGQAGVWVGTNGAGLNYLDLKTDRFTTWLAASNEPAAGANTIRTIIRQTDNQLWLGTDEGLFSFSVDTGNWDGPLKSDDLGTEIVRGMVMGRDGTMWLATDNGLGSYNPDTGRAFRDTHDPMKTESLGAKRILSVYEDAEGTIWAGTSSAGLAQRNAESGDYRHFREQDGLPNNVIYAILGGKDGDLWLSTNKGLCRFSPPGVSSGPRTRNYDMHDGLRNNEFNTGSCFQSANGNLYFGGINGYDVFRPEEITVNPLPPPLVITDFKVFDDSIAVGSSNTRGLPILEQVPGNGSTINLTWMENAFSFQFAALSYKASEKNTYRYKMEGFDEDWIEAKSRRFAAYTNLDPDNYRFRVIAANGDGTWNTDGITVPIHIAPPPWRTLPAYFIYVLLGLGLLIAIRRFELGRFQLNSELEIERLRAERLREMDRMKSRFFANISHEFRTPLTLILGPLRRLIAPDFDGNPRKYYNLMAVNGERLLRLINQLLDLARLESGRLPFQARRGDLVADLRLFALTFTSLAESREIDFQVNLSPIEERFYYDRDKVEKVVTNLLANAFRFTPGGGTVELGLCGSENAILIKVCDTGRGIPSERMEHIFDRFYQDDSAGPFDRKGSGIGLALAREMTELHGGRITVESTFGAGSCFLVSLPTGTDHFKPDQWTDEAPEQAQEPPQPVMPELPDSNLDIPARQSAHILLIEDHEEVRAHLREILARDYHLDEAAEANRGLSQATDRLPDLIISDVMMPGMDGIELTRRLKSDERTSHIPVVLLTARATSETRMAGLETGADAFLTKPFDPEELKLVATNLIEQRRLLRERFSSSDDLPVSDIAVTSSDERFLHRAVEVVEQFMGEPDFSVEEFGRELGMSRVQLYRKLRALTGTSPSLFVRSLRLKRAARLLRQEVGNVAEITFRVGFADPSYFARCFRAEFGKSPSAYSQAFREGSD